VPDPTRLLGDSLESIDVGAEAGLPAPPPPAPTRKPDAPSADGTTGAEGATPDEGAKGEAQVGVKEEGIKEEGVKEEGVKGDVEGEGSESGSESLTESSAPPPSSAGRPLTPARPYRFARIAAPHRPRSAGARPYTTGSASGSDRTALSTPDTDTRPASASAGGLEGGLESPGGEGQLGSDPVSARPGSSGSGSGGSRPGTGGGSARDGEGGLEGGLDGGSVSLAPSELPSLVRVSRLQLRAASQRLGERLIALYEARGMADDEREGRAGDLAQGHAALDAIVHDHFLLVKDKCDQPA
jgi:hypothetical protein